MQPKDMLEQYLQAMRDVRATGAGVKEESYYGALENLLNAVGATLKPHVRCVGQLANTGYGEPDFGFFTKEQFQGGAQAPRDGQKPLRGVVEVKDLDEPVGATSEGRQVARYLEGYGLVLVTNYRDFVLLALEDGRPVVRETFTLASDAPAFWRMAAHPRASAAATAEALVEFLTRVLLSNVPLSSPRDVAWFLASYAREARARVEAADAPALAPVRTTLEGALGIEFQGEKGEHFFRSTLVQTLFYGLFSAWVLWRQRGARGRFDWHSAGGELHVPMIQFLFEQLSMASRVRSLGLAELMDRATALLARVNAEAFFAQFSQDDAVQYFYEPFLEAFDPVLRKEMGVWYTPREIVRYMVVRVDTVLREELGIADGLADPNVVVLDPCCGTGAFLVEVLRLINETLHLQGKGALAELTLKHAAMHRVFGFEILPAPFVVAHLQLGLLLHTLGDELAGADERVGVYLTNALTGWEPPTERVKEQLAMLAMAAPEIRQEVDAATLVKQGEKILVILGNPPYNGFAGVAVEEERSLTNAYRTTKRAPTPQGQGLNDLYVRFYRMAERQIVERTKRGVVCFISNYSWLDGLSFTGMRERYLDAFDKVWIDCLNGDKYKTGKLTPDGGPDPSVFSAERNREGIQVGTAIGLLVRSSNEGQEADVRFRHFWGKRKREELLESLGLAASGASYQALGPLCALGLPFMPRTVGEAYLAWPQLPDLFPASSPGVKTSRDLDIVDIDQRRLRQRIARYFDQSIPNEQIRDETTSLMTRSGRFDPVATREDLLKRGPESGQFVRYCYRPFDIRYLYWHPETKLLDEKRDGLFFSVGAGNLFLTSRQKGERQREGTPFYVTRQLADWHLTRPGSACFPLYSEQVGRSLGMVHGSSEADTRPNISVRARAYLEGIGVACNAGKHQEAYALWFHVLAIGHTFAFLRENASALWQDWPRIPLPATRQALEASAGLGRQVAALLDPDATVDGITAGALQPAYRVIGAPARIGHGDLKHTDLAVTAGWGHAGRGGVTMPARGKAVERAYTDDERAALLTAVGRDGLTEARVFACLGETTYDIYLNEAACWRNVPARVWEYTLGGYQVLKKWLSYREEKLLGRALTLEEAGYVAEVTRRIAALLLLEPALDENYARVTADTYAWPGTGAAVSAKDS